ncbi:FecR domain-containing protein [Erythrobacter sp. GH1-10]|uniref:FecR domain-containing protein n=1 Tax=Erythrobacter sp. GH1-10 TaxID=3349334 RepID=UPI003877F93C
MASTSALASAPEWKVSEASGSVSIVRDGEVRSARANSSLEPGDVIRTGAKGRAVLVRGKEFVVVSPRAELQLAEPEKSGPIIQFFQNIGNALFRIEKKTTQHFGVKTPYLAAVVKGTTFNVSVTTSKSSVQVTEGAVEVATGNDLEAALLTPGMVGLVDAGNLENLVVIAGNRASGDTAGIVVRGAPEILAEPPKEPANDTARNVASPNSRLALLSSLDDQVAGGDTGLDAAIGQRGDEIEVEVALARSEAPRSNSGRNGEVEDESSVDPTTGPSNTNDKSAGKPKANGNGGENGIGTVDLAAEIGIGNGNGNAGGNGKGNAGGNGKGKGGGKDQDKGGAEIDLGLDLGLGTGVGSGEGNKGQNDGDGNSRGNGKNQGQGNSDQGNGSDNGDDQGGFDLGDELGLNGQGGVPFGDDENGNRDEQDPTGNGNGIRGGGGNKGFKP